MSAVSIIKPSSRQTQVSSAMLEARYDDAMTSLVPIVKWVGGKTQLLNEIMPRLPNSIGQYCEPFAGGYAVGLHLHCNNAIINDANRELMNVYAVVKLNVEGLIEALAKHKNDEEYFYALRNCDRDTAYFSTLTDVEHASRLLYLNKTCWSGMYRVNSHGEFNTPFGRYDKPAIVNAVALRALSDYLNNNNIQLYGVDAMDILDVADIAPCTFFYLDPPYTPVSQTSSFTGYTASGFSFSDQERLYQFCLRLHAEGHLFLLSNSNHPAIMNLYREFSIDVVNASRRINCKANKRGAVKEVLIRNYVDDDNLLPIKGGMPDA